MIRAGLGPAEIIERLLAGLEPQFSEPRQPVRRHSAATLTRRVQGGSVPRLQAGVRRVAAEVCVRKLKCSAAARLLLLLLHDVTYGLRCHAIATAILLFLRSQVGLAASCPCSEERVMRTLSLLPQSEIDDIIECQEVRAGPNSPTRVRLTCARTHLLVSHGTLFRCAYLLLTTYYLLLTSYYVLRTAGGGGQVRVLRHGIQQDGRGGGDRARRPRGGGRGGRGGRGVGWAARPARTEDELGGVDTRSVG